MTGQCDCGQPVFARGRCRRCYGTWWKTTNPYKKRLRPETPTERYIRQRLRDRRASGFGVS